MSRQKMRNAKPVGGGPQHSPNTCSASLAATSLRLRTNQRQVVDNRISHETFWRMTRCAFLNTAVDEDVMAVLKRAHVIVFGHRRIYVRMAGSSKKTVEAMDYPVGDRDLLVSTSKEAFNAYKSGEPTTASEQSGNGQEGSWHCLCQANRSQDSNMAPERIPSHNKQL